MLGIDQVEVGNVVNKPAIHLLGDVGVEAAVPSLQVVHGHLKALRHYRGDRRVGVAEHDQSLRPQLQQGFLDPDERAGQHLAERGGVHPQVPIRGTESQLVEEDLRQAIIPVLAGVDEDMVEGGVEAGKGARQPDDLWPRPDNGHDPFGSLSRHRLGRRCRDRPDRTVH